MEVVGCWCVAWLHFAQQLCVWSIVWMHWTVYCAMAPAPKTGRSGKNTRGTNRNRSDEARSRENERHTTTTITTTPLTKSHHHNHHHRHQHHRHHSWRRRAQRNEARTNKCVACLESKKEIEKWKAKASQADLLRISGGGVGCVQVV